jgi:hypothetical protein
MADSGKVIRRTSLILLILFDIVMLLFWWLAGQYVFFWVFVAITLSVLIGELVNVLFFYKKTLSTQAKHTIQAGGKKRFYVYAALLFLGLAISSLIVHLGVAW